VRDGKGHQDRVTMLPQQVKAPLQRHLHDVQQLHGQDLQAGGGHVYLPYALERKYPNASHAWVWQYVFPAARLSRDPRRDSPAPSRPQIGLAASRAGCRPAGGDPQGSKLSYFTTRLCDPSARSRIRHPDRPGTPRAQRRADNDDLLCVDSSYVQQTP
jgi:hypothetical protein